MARDPVRDEAERLIAAAIGSLSMAARGLGTGGRPFATGSEECCVCPVCRVIAAMREPDPGVADRLATGAGDLATAVAGILRSFGRAAPTQSRPEHGEPPSTDDEDPWRAATAPPPPKPMAKKAVKKPAPPAKSVSSRADHQAESTAKRAAPAKKVAKKAAPAKKAAKKAAPRKNTGAGG